MPEGCYVGRVFCDKKLFFLFEISRETKRSSKHKLKGKLKQKKLERGNESTSSRREMTKAAQRCARLTRSWGQTGEREKHK